MSQAYAWSKMKHPMKLTTWAVIIIKDSIKEDHQDSIRAIIFCRTMIGDIIQVITSTKGVHPISILARGRVIKRSPLT